MQSTTLAAPGATAIQLKEILVPMDFSQPSEQALIYAMRFGKQFGADITLLYVLEQAVVGDTRPDLPLRFGYSEEEASEAGKQLHSLAAMIAPGARKGARVEIRRGVAANEIIECAKQLGTDLIVIATHGYTGWKHFCIGSTAECVVRTAPCPVLVVREKEHDFI